MVSGVFMRFSALRPLPAVFLVIGLAACAPGADMPAMPPYSTAGYRLGAGDQIRVITFGSDQLGGQFNVDDKGLISMPLVGNVEAAGLSPDELADRLKERLRSGGFVKNPSVAVEVVTYRPVFILGEVVKPGQYPFQPGMTTLTAVAIAGGFTYRAVESYASDVRTIDGHVVEGKVVPSSLLAPGDVIKVYERHF
jgi:polysaccharide export outer membrane protein